MPPAHRGQVLAQGGHPLEAVDVQGVEDDPGGQADVGLRPPLPPARQLGGVEAGVLDAVPDQRVLGRPVAVAAARAGAGQAGPVWGGAGPVDRVDGDAAGGIGQGGVQQVCHATRLPGAVALVMAW
jgi:hypothetical protein